MDTELLDAIRSQISDFPCCDQIDQKNMTKAQDLVHELMAHLYCGGKSFNLAQAIKTWRSQDFEVFLGKVSELKSMVEEYRKPSLVDN